MFTGIIEKIAKVVSLEKEGSNLHITCASPLAKEFKIDQSISHNGVCLTVVKINDDEYTLTAVKETLELSNLSSLKIGDEINIERCIDWRKIRWSYSSGSCRYYVKMYRNT